MCLGVDKAERSNLIATSTRYRVGDESVYESRRGSRSKRIVTSKRDCEGEGKCVAADEAERSKRIETCGPRNDTAKMMRFDVWMVGGRIK